MAQSFSFGFASDDIEEDGNETVELGLHDSDTPANEHAAVAEPKLHKLQDLV